MPTPITVITGFLGAGKTTLILNTLKRVPKDYKIVVLKNEFGDVEVDSELVKEGNVEVTEMMNGCLCCVLVGQMKNALIEIKEKFTPDRIVVETSGSAFPAPIAWQIREMEREGVDVELDSILTVIDCVNFQGYEDTSYTAKLQAKYTDVILLNKWELVTERQLDLLIDKVDTLNDETPKVKVDKDLGVDPDLIFGIDTKLFENKDDDLIEWREMMDTKHHSREIDLLQVVKVKAKHVIHRHEDCQDGCDLVDVVEASPMDCSLVDRGELEKLLSSLPKEDVFRVKGLVRFPEGLEILNCAFGRWTLTPMTRAKKVGETHGETLLEDVVVKVTVMGKGLMMYAGMIREGLRVEIGNEGGRVWYIPADRPD